MWMVKLTTSIAKSPKWKGLRVREVACSSCLCSLEVAEAYVDRDGYLWCRSCKDER